MLQDFKKFILRGNVVDLAVAVIIGAAFTGIITALVKDIITPLIGSVYKASDFSKSYFVFHGSQFGYGDFVNAVINFLIVAFIVFFLVVLPVNRLAAHANRRSTPTPEVTTKKCPECLSEIPIDARRCAFCTTVLKPVTK
jgi:large conductance mechanosensitive channel